MTKRGRLELLTGLVGINSLQRTSQETLKNQQAENAFVRRNTWGENATSEPVEEDMQTVLGDLNTTTNVTNSESPLAKIAIAAGLLATGTGVPIAAYFVADAINNRPIAEQPAPVEHTDTDTTIEMSLPDPAGF